MEEPKEQSPEKFKSLIEWSKWLITINFAAATGCTIVLQNVVKSGGNLLLKGELALAIVAFAICTILAVSVIYKISILSLQIPDSPEKVHKPQKINKLDIVHKLAKSQLISFIVALFFFGLWIATKTFQKPKEKKLEPACCVTGKPA